MVAGRPGRGCPALRVIAPGWNRSAGGARLHRARDRLSHPVSFSTENWSRPAEEVGELMRLLRFFVRSDLATLQRQNVRIRIIGEREGLAPDILRLLEEAEASTAGNTGLTLVIAFNYGARAEMVRAVRKLASAIAAGNLPLEALNEATISAALDTADIPDPDLSSAAAARTDLEFPALAERLYRVCVHAGSLARFR